MSKTPFAILACACLAHTLHGATHEIANAKLKVRYDDAAQTFSVAERGSGKLFLPAAKLEGQASVDGKRMVLTQADGQTALELRGEEPFVFITKSVRNTTTNTLDISTIVPVTFRLDLGKPAAELRTLGTGGLLPPDQNPGSYVFLTCADPATRRGVVAGWITQDRGSGVLFSGVQDGQVEFKAQIDYGHLRIPPGQSAQLETLAIGCFDDARIGQELFAATIQKHYAIQLRPRTAVYCTWYADGHGGAGDEKSTVELAHFMAKELKDFGLTVIQIDDHWQDGPHIDGPTRGFERARPKGPYPNGIEPVARQVDDLGLTLGLWWLPFGRNHADPAWKDRQDWFAKWADGKPLRTRGFGGTCLDLTHPDVQQHLAGLAKLYRDWGVKYYKMDGLWTGTATEQIYINDGYKDDHMSNVAPFHDPSKTQIEAFRDGLKLLRKGAGDDVFFSGCAVSQNMRSFGGSMGLVDAMRIGPDFNHDGQGIKTGPLRASRLYFLNGRVWWNDPDPTKVRATNAGGSADASATGAVSLDMAQLTTTFSALSGQFFLLSDWLPNLPPERIQILKRTMISHDGVARPVDYFDHALPYVWLLSDKKQDAHRHVIGLFNWEGKPQHLGATLAKAGLDPAKTYHAFDFWKNALLPDVRESFSYEVRPAACRAIALRAAEGRPVLISTSRHVTQGIVDVKEEQWSSDTLSGVSHLIAHDPCELRIRVPDGWKLEKASAAAIESPGLVRMTLASEASRDVPWSARFNKVPPAGPATVTGLQATQSNAFSPVILAWSGNSTFHEISRDGVVIEAGQHGCSYEDLQAAPGKSHLYTVRALEGGTVASVSVVAKAIDLGPVPPKPAVSLMSLTPQEATTGWGSVGIGKAAAGTPLRLGADTFADGIGLHANARAVYDVKPEYHRFVAIVGIDESKRSENQSSLLCKVVVDGKVLTQTPVLKFGGVERWHIDAPVPAGAKRIELVVDDAGDGIASDHADWVNAGFLTAP